jgi:GT2 family glycosyltransferase
MALIAMCCWDTEDNGRSWMTSRTIESLVDTVDPARHRLIVVDNGSCQATKDILDFWTREISMGILDRVITLPENIGTARAINKAWELKRPGEICVKMDNDVVINETGWLDQLEAVFTRDPTIGIAGLKRKDLEECPWSKNVWYRSTIRMLPHQPGERWLIVEEVLHVMGTCQAYSPLLLEKIGYLCQMGGLYGFDDALASLRAHEAKFKTVFTPDVDIDHIDPGTTAYQGWKEKYAGMMMEKYELYRDEYRSGKRPLYCGPEG